MAKPRQPEAASITLGRIEQLLADVVSWSNDRICQAVTDDARRRRFSESSWQRRTAKLEDLAVWPGMGGLSPTATSGSAIDTARYIIDNGMPQDSRRLRAFVAAARDDPSGIERVCRTLPLIAVEYGMVRKEHGQSTPWVLDDGSHRAVVLACISPHVEVDVVTGMRIQPVSRGRSPA